MRQQINGRSFVFVAFICAFLLSVESVSGDQRVYVPAPRVDIQILVNGRPLEQQGTGNYRYVPVRRIHQEYTLRIINHTPRRLEAVVAVDGLSVMNGRKHSEKTRGYLVPANSSLDIPGWRKGNREVAAFEFKSERDSHAFQRGHRSEIGMIRFVAFEESAPVYRVPTPIPFDKFQPTPAGARQYQSAQNRRDARAFEKTQEKTGTGYGRTLQHQVEEVKFERSNVRHIVTLQYGKESRLR